MGCMGYGNGRGWVVMVVSSKLLRLASFLVTNWVLNESECFLTIEFYATFIDPPSPTIVKIPKIPFTILKSHCWTEDLDM